MLEAHFSEQKIFSAADIKKIKAYCISENELCFGSSVLYISCHKKNSDIVVHIVMDCVVVGLTNNNDNNNIRIAAPLCDGNYIRIVESDLSVLTVSIPQLIDPTIAVVDNFYIDLISDFFGKSQNSLPNRKQPTPIHLVK